jgi:hypothetical protein
MRLSSPAVRAVAGRIPEAKIVSAATASTSLEILKAVAG